MEFLTFKNILIDSDIKLFDPHYRLSYSNMFKLNDSIYFQQTGGGKSENEFYISPFVLIKQNNKKKNKLLINKLIDNNITSAKYICKNDLILHH